MPLIETAKSSVFKYASGEVNVAFTILKGPNQKQQAIDLLVVLDSARQDISAFLENING